LVVVDGLLTRLNGETTTSLVAVSGPVIYALLNDEVYWTDGVEVGQVTAAGDFGTWGMKNPPTPLCVAVPNGGLFAGTYQIAMTAIHASGLESGASEIVFVEVPEGGGIEVATPSATGVRFAFYRTPAQGTQGELRRALVTDPDTLPLLGAQPLGQLLETFNVVRPLPGQCLIHHKGRLWVASGRVVWFTSEKSPHWLQKDSGYYQFESPVTMLGATEDGIYVGLYDQVYYLQGSDPTAMTQRPVSTVGAVQGGSERIPYDLFLGEGSFPSRQCAWWEADGQLCIGKPGGIIVRPSRKAYSAGEISRGSVVYRDYNGLRQLISTLSIEQNGPTISVDNKIFDVFPQGVVLNA
jgi:hypothetical protein